MNVVARVRALVEALGAQDEAAVTEILRLAGEVGESTLTLRMLSALVGVTARSDGAAPEAFLGAWLAAGESACAGAGRVGTPINPWCN